MRVPVRLLAHVAALLVVVAAIAYVARGKEHVPPYDANLVRLAESRLQGFCAGEVLFRSGGEGDAELAANCRRTRRAQRSNKPAIAAVPVAFCQAVVDQGWEGGGVGECVVILTENKLWPTYDGGLSDAWNRARRYPGRALATVGTQDDGSRTGDRPESLRQGNTRGG